MQNAFDLQDQGPEGISKFQDIVYNSKHPLSYALNQNAGCCRYQATLFFVLSNEAKFDGYLLSAPAGSIRTCFNGFQITNPKTHKKEDKIVSIFLGTLKNDKYNYGKYFSYMSQGTKIHCTTTSGRYTKFKD